MQASPAPDPRGAGIAEALPARENTTIAGPWREARFEAAGGALRAPQASALAAPPGTALR